MCHFPSDITARDPGKRTNTGPRLGLLSFLNTNLLEPSHKMTRGKATKEITPGDGFMWVKLQSRNQIEL